MRLFKKNIMKNKNAGLTLIELIITMALVAIVGTFLISNYTNTLEDQRMTSDMTKINKIDITLKQIILEDEIFDEFNDLFKYDYKNKKGIFEDGNLILRFQLEMDPTTEESSVVLSTDEGTCNVYLMTNGGMSMVPMNSSGYLPNTYMYLIERVGNEIKLDSRSYKKGEYIVTIDFNYTKLNEARQPTLSDDSFNIINSGADNIRGKYGE